jgi:hypothetical protein
VLSDFEIFDHDLDQVYARLRALPGLTLAIVLRSDPPDELVSSGTPVERVAPDAPSAAVADAVGKLIATGRTGPRKN